MKSLIDQNVSQGTCNGSAIGLSTANSGRPMVSEESDCFFREYTSPDAILKYTTATAGVGISYLLDHDYKTVYLEAIKRLPQQVGQHGIRMLEFGCGGGMNLLHLVSVLSRDGFNVASAIGTDFSPVLIQAANKEAQ